MKLGVNIDHVATLRQQRREREPDPVAAALAAEMAGAESIVCHLREDRRHIQDDDLALLRRTVKTKLNLEMAAGPEIVAIALREKPDWVTIVPERREELTTEGGLAVKENHPALARVVRQFSEAGIPVSFFVDPDPEQIQCCAEIGARSVEIHTGRYAVCSAEAEQEEQLRQVIVAAEAAAALGLKVAAGHGLDYRNVGPIVRISEVEELNIGFAIIGRAVFTGLDSAVRAMRELMGPAARGGLM